MATLRKQRNKNGDVYVVDFSYGGKRIVRSTKTTNRREAQRILDDIQGRIARGKFRLDDYSKDDIRLSVYLEEYFSQHTRHKMKSTINGEKTYTKTFLELVGDRILRSIDKSTMYAWKDARLKKVNPVTYNLERRTLQAIFSVAKELGYLDENPFKWLPKLAEEQRRLYLEDDEISVLLAAMQKDAQDARNAPQRKICQLFKQCVELALYTGLRRSELLRLESSNIDLKSNRIHVEESKSKKHREIPLMPKAREILRAIGEDMFRSLNKDWVSRKFAEYCQRVGLQGFKFHSLRHTFATKLIEVGVDILTVSKLLGHSDIRTTMIYAKVQPKIMQKAIDRLGESYSATPQLPESKEGLVREAEILQAISIHSRPLLMSSANKGM